MLNDKTNKGSFAHCSFSEISSSEEEEEEDTSNTLEVRMSLPHEYYRNFENEAHAFDLNFSDDENDDDSNIIARGVVPRVVLASGVVPRVGPKSHPIPDDSNIFSCP